MKQNKKIIVAQITVDDVVTSSGKYMERKNHKELTKEVLDNIAILVEKVNELLKHLQWTEPIVVSSGFRPSDVNNKVKNAAAKSAHMLGMAVDIAQPKYDNKLANAIIKAQQEHQILTKLGLWMEDPNYTIGQYSSWVHLDFKSRPNRPSRIFKP